MVTEAHLPFLSSIRLSGLLSFRPDSSAIPLLPLNVIIGPNGSGKSNLIEAIELLHAAPTAFASAVREGGGVREWLWKGTAQTEQREAEIEAKLRLPNLNQEFRYRLRFAAEASRVEITDEALENWAPLPGKNDVYFYYRFQQGHPVINVRDGAKTSQRHLERQDLQPDESVLSQRKGEELYPELTRAGKEFDRIQLFREWAFGRFAPLRQPQKVDLPSQRLLPDGRNLAMVLNRLDHSTRAIDFNNAMRKFLPRFERISTSLEGGAAQLYLHESGLGGPIPATRLSDGTIRFIAILALLLAPEPASLVCIEEPELGLHPDALVLLADLMVDASERMQLVVTTHSEALISALSGHAGAVMVCENNDGTTFRRLSTEMLREWLAQYQLGEIWRMGELAGNP